MVSMDSEMKERLDALEKKIDAIYSSAEKTRKYFLTVLIGSAVALVLPLIGLLFAIPTLLSTYSDMSGLLQ